MESVLEKKVEVFFSNQEYLISLFKSVKEMIHSIAPETIEVNKSQISFGTKTKFAWVWQHKPWLNNRPENAIVLTFCVGRYIEHDQIVEAIEPFPGRWIHHVMIRNESELTSEVNKWLEEAYHFSKTR
ncbi:DUF5655 domain-containing protein [Neobacillus sp. PS2-9]|uniref:DUF5655 domain-containing protein n=1 Tax=Neobacillus sp. PS2-9 TaxID=3070676 RepID=UPI0027E0C23E|nr:DUF5655 domain-containing protein [Neobacillus sp. PS2-9]WML57406.1 DUF5655 domain-containing protein [Neobacillus sp. PS2-9]